MVNDTGAVAPDRRWMAIAGLLLSVALLIPGLVAPVITVRGTLDPDGVATLAPQLLEKGLTDQTLATLRPMFNPALLPLLEMAPGGLKGAVTNQLGAMISTQLRNGGDVEVYRQTRSILGSVEHLYSVKSFVAATLILVFSVLVPFTKASLVMWALYHRDRLRQRRTLNFVEVIAKWSMADVFAVALFIAYLAAQASQTPASAAPSATAAVRFDASFGPGFYWFAAYCLVSLAVQQYTARKVIPRVTAA